MSMPFLKLLDIDFPESFVKDFQGPKFGIEGIRKYLGAENRPLLNNMIKPCTGYTPGVGAKLFFEAAAGGLEPIFDGDVSNRYEVADFCCETVKEYFDNRTL